MSDYELTSVPQSERRSLWAVTSVWVGYVFLLASMMAGAGLAAQMPLSTVILVTVLANLLLAALASVMSMISFKTGYTFAVMTRFSFGLHGSKLPSILYAVIQMGWYTIQASIYGHLIAVAFELGPLGESLAMVGSGVVMGLFGIAGIKALEILSFVSIPAMVFICIGTVMRSAGDAGGWATLFAAQPQGEMSFFAAVSIVIGTWVFGAATTVADFNRFARSKGDAVKGAVLGLLLVNSFVVLCGAVVGAAAGEHDMVKVLMGIGLVVPAFVLLTTNLWTTNGANIYSVGLTLSNVFSVSRRKIMVAVVAITSGLTLFRPYELDAIFGILITAGIVVPPLAGVIISDFYLINKSNYPALDKYQFVGFNHNALIAWLCASATAWFIPWGIQAVNALLVAFVVYTLLMKLSGYQVFTPQQPTAQP